MTKYPGDLPTGGPVSRPWHGRSFGRFLPLCLLTAVLIAGCAVTPAPEVADGPVCQQSWYWVDPASKSRLNAKTVVENLSRQRVVLLGEVHDRLEDHLWQAQMLAALHAYRPNTVLAFEMFPRSVQTALDDWVRGDLSEKQFLEAARWREVWGYELGFYMPMFQFARQNRLPMVGANVERSLIRRVSQEGWSEIPEDEKKGIGTPAPASEAYRRSLARVYIEKLRQRPAHTRPHGEKPKAETEETDPVLPTIDEVLEKPEFLTFVEAQLTWDRAMAEAIAVALQKNPDSLVIGVMGRGHAQYGHGVPHQLRDLGVADVAVTLPIAISQCTDLPNDIADAVFLVADPQPAPPPKPRPLLGVVIEDTEKGVRIARVTENSVAKRAKLLKGDVVLRAAGFDVGKVTELVGIIRRQAPGTWLPLKVRRGKKEMDVIAKFPTEFGPAK